MPAEAGIHLRMSCNAKKTWIPAYAGMTSGRIEFQSTYYDPLGLNPTGILFSLRLRGE